MTSPAGREPTDAALLRISDAERAVAAGAIDEAVADGRLTWAEHSERTDLIWSARTRGDLAPMLADLGQRATVDTARPQRVSSFLSKVHRAPSSASRHLHARAVFGAIVLDLSAMGPGEQLLVRASSFCGKVVIKVADDATVIDDGMVLLGKRAIRGWAPPAGGPVVHISGLSAFGTLKVFRASQGEWDQHHQPSFPFGQPYDQGGDRHYHLHRDKHVHIHQHEGYGHHDWHHRKHHKRHKWDGRW